MSAITYVEAASADPFVRDLHRRAVRLLNDPSLDRRGRELHMGRLQSILMEHLRKEEARAASRLGKKAAREGTPHASGNQGAAEATQVLARRREFAAAMPEVASTGLDLASQKPLPVARMTADDSNATGRKRPVLSLPKS